MDIMMSNIAVTTLSCKEGVNAAINSGMNSYIIKSVESRILLSTLLKYLKCGREGDLNEN